MKRWVMGGTLLVAAGCIGGLIGAQLAATRAAAQPFPPSSRANVLEADTIRTRNLEIGIAVPPLSRPVAVFSAEDQGARLIFQDTFALRTASPRLEVDARTERPAITLYNVVGAPAARVAVNDQRQGAITVLDDRGLPLIVARAQGQGGPLLDLLDANQKARISIGIDPQSGTPFLRVLDADGAVLYEAPLSRPAP